MSADASAPARESVSEFDELQGTLDTLLQESLGKVESGRVYDAENERVRQGWIRLAKDIVAEQRKVKADRDLEELTERIEELEEAGGWAGDPEEQARARTSTRRAGDRRRGSRSGRVGSH